MILKFKIKNLFFLQNLLFKNNMNDDKSRIMFLALKNCLLLNFIKIYKLFNVFQFTKLI